VKPVIVELTDFKTKEKVDELEVDAVLVATGRAPYTQVILPQDDRLLMFLDGDKCLADVKPCSHRNGMRQQQQDTAL
jgi:hypothetical protein